MPSLNRSRRAGVVCAVLSLAVALCITATAEAASSSRAANAPACLRGHWVASTAESQRVLEIMVPGPYTFTAELYTDVRGGTLAYGTPAFVIEAGGSARRATSSRRTAAPSSPDGPRSRPGSRRSGSWDSS